MVELLTTCDACGAVDRHPVCVLPHNEVFCKTAFLECGPGYPDVALCSTCVPKMKVVIEQLNSLSLQTHYPARSYIQLLKQQQQQQQQHPQQPHHSRGEVPYGYLPATRR